MKFFTRASIILVSLLIIACGTTKEEIDYSQITDIELLQMGDSQFEKGEYKKAISLYNKLLLDFPTSNLHIDTQLKMAEAYGKLDNFEEQHDMLHRLLLENIIPERVPQIYIQIGKFYERAALWNPGIVSTDTSDYKDAIRYYTKALKYPDSDDNTAKSEAMYRHALVEAKIGQIEDAISRYRLIGSLFPESSFNLLAQMKLKDPADTAELAVSDSALTSYRVALGIETAPAEAEDAAAANEGTIETEQPTQSDSDLESTIDQIGEESTEGQENSESTDSEGTDESDMESVPNNSADEEDGQNSDEGISEDSDSDAVKGSESNDNEGDDSSEDDSPQEDDTASDDEA